MEPVRVPVPRPADEVDDGARNLHIILVEEDEADAALILSELGSAGLEPDVRRATSEAELRALLEYPNLDALICDHSVPGLDALRALAVRRECGVTAPLIVVSAGLSDERTAECMRLGAADYVHMDRLGRLPHALVQAVGRARFETASRESERRYRRMFENVPLAVFRDTVEGRILQANAASIAMFGFDHLEGLLATSLPDLHVDSADRATLLARLEAEGDVLGFECRMRRADGSEFWFSRAVQAVRGDDGRVLEMESIGWNSSQRRQAVLELGESEAYLSTVIETAPDAVVRVDERGAITDWNSEAERTFGWKRSEILGRRLSETIIPADLREQHLNGMARFRAEGTTKVIGQRWDKFFAVRKGGELFPIELAISPPILLGTATQFVGFIRDITERRRAELELAKSEERMRSLLMGAPVGILTTDLEGRFTFAGGSVFAEMQIDGHNLVGVAVADAAANRPDFAAFVKAGVEDEVQAEFVSQGHTFQVLSGPFRLSADGPVIGARTVAFDTTERVESDRALRRSEEVFRALFEQSAVGMALQDVPREAVTTVVRWNRRMREMLGVDSNLDDRSWTDSIEPRAQGGMEGEFDRLLSGESDEVRQRLRLVRQDGSKIWADISTVLVRDGERQPLRFQTMALDITEQVEAEERLSRRAAQETVLLQLSRAGLEGQETADFLITAAELVAAGAGTEFATVLELRPAEACFIRVAASGNPRGIPREPASLDLSSRVLDALKTEAPVVAFDYLRQPDVERSPWMIEQGVVASMAVGIGGPVRPFGVLSVHSSQTREFTGDDLQFMQMAATIISVAIERKSAEQQRRMLLSRLVTAQEAERKIIAEDIHDDAVQVMTAANMRLEMFRMSLTDPVQLRAAEKLQEVVALATGRLRNLLFELSPGAVDRHGLAAAVRIQLEQFEIDAGVRWHLDDDLLEEPAAQPRILLYRIFQEALANVRKHARAHAVHVSLASVERGVLMRLLDDGVGFAHPASVEQVVGHLGLASMRERAESAGGWWRLTSQPGHGTDMSTWVPSLPDPGVDVPSEALALG